MTNPSWNSLLRKILAGLMGSTTMDNKEQNSSVLLLGASGQLGQMLRTCWPAPQTLVSHSRQERPDFIQFDLILEPEKASAAMGGASAVICLPGITNANASATGEVYSRNTDLALAAITAAAKARVPRVFLASSAAIYGAAKGLQKETDTPRPVAPYGQAKLEMEQSAITLANVLNQPITNLRIGNVAGADAILGGWRAGMQIDQLANGQTPSRSYIGPQTLARVLAQLCNAPDLPQVLNLATPGTVEMGALLSAAALPWSPRPAPAGVIPKVELSTNLLERYVSFAPEDSSAVGLVNEWHSYREKRQNSQ